MALLEVRNVNAGYGEVQVLYDVSFSVSSGEIASIVGSNGAGKTTLIKTISGIVPLRSGDIYFDGKRMNNAPPHLIVEAGIVQVPEGRGLFPYMTVLENLEIGASTPRAKAKRTEMMKHMLELFPILGERSKQMARTLSGGEQQMLATARALMAMPRLLMLDEPSLGLAPLIVKQLFETVERINQEGTTILVVEQNVQRVLSMANQGYVLENGQIVMSGPGPKLLADPQLKAAYLGL
jgi:branched-chain amino acid transport system ATP-binding protein